MKIVRTFHKTNSYFYPVKDCQHDSVLKNDLSDLIYKRNPHEKRSFYSQVLFTNRNEATSLFFRAQSTARISTFHMLLAKF